MQHFDQLLHERGTVGHAARGSFPDIPTNKKAIAVTKENKAPGGCGIPSEMWKHYGIKLKERLFDRIDDIWKKCSSKEFDNYRGISLLSIAGEVINNTGIRLSMISRMIKANAGVIHLY